MKKIIISYYARLGDGEIKITHDRDDLFWVTITN